jgi:transposase
VELFEQIRREYEFGIGTVLGVSQKFGVHRRTVRQAVENAMPPDRKVAVKHCPALDPVKPFIEAMLVADKRSPRKQRHTAHRIWTRLRGEHPEFPVAESTVRTYVRHRKWELGLAGQQTHVPQEYDWGQEAQVDWYEAYSLIGGQHTKVQVFAMRSMKSGGAFHQAYLHATQQAFLDAHQKAFAYFGGVFHVLRYDNLASAVKKVLRGYTREEHTRFTAFHSHWHFKPEFCGVAQPQEKGGVEGELGTFRRNHLVPVPEVCDLESLNHHILSECIADHSRQIGNRESPVGTMMVAEREHLLPLQTEDFDVAEVRSSLVDAKGCVKARLNWYSTPLRAGTKVQVRALPSVMEVWYGGNRLAVHGRCYERGKEIYNLEHYLDVLDKKPGAFPGGLVTIWSALMSSGMSRLPSSEQNCSFR